MRGVGPQRWSTIALCCQIVNNLLDNNLSKSILFWHQTEPAPVASSKALVSRVCGQENPAQIQVT
jgi:hypothetical protein